MTAQKNQKLMTTEKAGSLTLSSHSEAAPSDGPAVAPRLISGTSAENQLLSFLNSLVGPAGYEIIHLDVQSGRPQRTLRLFIDRLGNRSTQGTTIGIEDCVKVSRLIDEPLDQDALANELIGALFNGSTYELEVSSPGTDRPLRKEDDFDRFKGADVRIHLYRPLSAAEIENADYCAKNPKQKNFLGKLQGLRDGKVWLALPDGSAPSGKKGQKKKLRPEISVSESSPTNSVAAVAIPLPLISKANLELQFDLSRDSE